MAKDSVIRKCKKTPRKPIVDNIFTHHLKNLQFSSFLMTETGYFPNDIKNK